MIQLMKGLFRLNIFTLVVGSERCAKDTHTHPARVTRISTGSPENTMRVGINPGIFLTSFWMSSLREFGRHPQLVGLFG